MKEKRIVRAVISAVGFVLLFQTNAHAVHALVPVGEAAGIALEACGALVVGFAADSPAKDAGVKKGDSIVSADGGIFSWQPNSEQDTFFVNTLNRETSRKKISDALSSLTGRPCSFETAARTPGAGKNDDSEEAYINRLYETFGKEPVIVKE